MQVWHRTDSMQPQLAALIESPHAFTSAMAAECVDHIVAGLASPAQTAAFLVALRLSGLDSVPEMVAAVASALKRHALPVRSSLALVDIVGTGGDGAGAFNVSTAAGIVAAGAGCVVAKHGNRASSSSCGSGDVLEALGANLESLQKPEEVNNLFKSSRFCFLYAQSFYPTLKSLAAIRKELGVRTVFNIIGPLLNPASPSRMILGVYSKSIGRMMAQILQLNHVHRAWVVHGEIGLDEISTEGDTFVWSLENNKIEEFTISAKDFGLPSHSIDQVRGGNASFNANLLQSLLNNHMKNDAILDFTLMNSAALLYISGKATCLLNGVQLARKSISSGAALLQLNNYIKATTL